MRRKLGPALAALAALTIAVPLAAAVPAAAAAPAATSTTTAETTAPTAFHATTITRTLDTRAYDYTPNHAVRPLGPGENFTSPLSTFTGHHPPGPERGVVPAAAVAVVVNVKVVNPTQDGHLTLTAAAAPDGSAPATSTLNFLAGQTVSNTTTVAVTSRGENLSPSINVFNSAGYTDVVIDVLGWYVPGAVDKYEPTAPVRLADTRTTGTKLGQYQVLPVDVARPELAGATSVVLNVTATGAESNSFLTVFDDATYLREGSNLNFVPGQTVANQVIVPVARDGTVKVRNHNGSTHVVVDLVGYYSPNGHGLYNAFKTATRLYDTRTTFDRLEPYTTREFALAGKGGLPATPWAVALNATATLPSGQGHLEVFRADGARSGTSSLNFTVGQTVANAVTTETGGTVNGVRIYSHSGPTHLILDALGYFTTG